MAEFDPQDFLDLVHCIDKDQIKELSERIYSSCDTNNNGCLELEELVVMMKKMAECYAQKTGGPEPTDEQAETVARNCLAQIDADGDGSITKIEWFAFACK
jgi:hypothetical protein